MRATVCRPAPPRPPPPPHHHHHQYTHTPSYSHNWLKIRAHNFTQYDAILLLDSDTAVVGDLSPLWRLPAPFAAVWDQSKWLNRYKTALQASGGAAASQARWVGRVQCARGGAGRGGGACLQPWRARGPAAGQPAHQHSPARAAALVLNPKP